MIRVHVICEGQTEERFVNELLVHPLASMNILAQPALIGKPGHKGGNLRFERLYKDIRNKLLGDRTAYCTTFFDYYGLPGDFPGKLEAGKYSDHEQKFNCVLMSIFKQLEKKLGPEPMRRFIPYVQMHEFEGLLFSDPAALARGMYHQDLKQYFLKIRAQFISPEEINDKYEFAPSKRIQKLCSEYEKPLHGLLAALEIGLDVIRQECPLFHDWLTRIEKISTG